MPAKDFANTRFSGLTQVNKSDVAQLQVAFTFYTGVLAGQGSAPLMVDDTLYLMTPYPNNLIAIDLTKPGGALKFKVEPKPDAAAQGTACCDIVNRGPTYSDGTIYFNTIDAHTLAVDAETGEVKWKTKVGDFEKGETMTMAPLVVRDKVFVGNSGAWMADGAQHLGRLDCLARPFDRARRVRADRPRHL